MSMTLSGNGTITGLVSGGLPDGTITQAELTTGVAGTGPAFSAYASNSQSISNNSSTKLAFNAENFDTASCFDSTTNYRFTPNVAGYYQINLMGSFGSLSSGIVSVSIIKNGISSIATSWSATVNQYIGTSASTVVYLNGSTDYIEGYIYQNSGSSASTLVAGSSYTIMSGSMVRAA